MLCTEFLCLLNTNVAICRYLAAVKAICSVMRDRLLCYFLFPVSGVYYIRSS